MTMAPVEIPPNSKMGISVSDMTSTACHKLLQLLKHVCCMLAAISIIRVALF
jgi:hypothetical protein